MRLKELAEFVRAKLEQEIQPSLFTPEQIAEKVIAARARQEDKPLPVDLSGLREGRFDCRQTLFPPGQLLRYRHPVHRRRKQVPGLTINLSVFRLRNWRAMRLQSPVTDFGTVLAEPAQLKLTVFRQRWYNTLTGYYPYNRLHRK